MRTVDKALKLLSFFSVEKADWGLSEIARESGLDKATALRMLTSLRRHGLLEQHPQTRKYRLGTALLNLARIREASFPVTSIIQPIVDRLAETTGETAHASLAGDDAMMTIAIAEPQRSTRVHVDPSQPLPFHATASGTVFLAFAAETTAGRALGRKRLAAHTSHTVTTADGLKRRVEAARRQGYAVSEQTFEDEVVGIAAPIFDWSGHASGAIAVATPVSRMTAELRSRVITSVLEAAVETTRMMGAEPPAEFLAASKELAA